MTLIRYNIAEFSDVGALGDFTEALQASPVGQELLQIGNLTTERIKSGRWSVSFVGDQWPRPLLKALDMFQINWVRGTRGE